MTLCDAVGRLSRLINVVVIMTLCDAVGRLFQKGRGGSAKNGLCILDFILLGLPGPMMNPPINYRGTLF